MFLSRCLETQQIGEETNESSENVISFQQPKSFYFPHTQLDVAPFEDVKSERKRFSFGWSKRKRKVICGGRFNCIPLFFLISLRWQWEKINLPLKFILHIKKFGKRFSFLRCRFQREKKKWKEIFFFIWTLFSHKCLVLNFVITNNHFVPSYTRLVSSKRGSYSSFSKEIETLCFRRRGWNRR